MTIIYGGAFNPPTIAHKRIVEELLNVYNPIKLIIVPVGDYYAIKHNLVSFKHRYNMLQLLNFDKTVEISEYEQELSSYMGTFETLNYFNQKYDNLFFVMGADNVIGIKQWINYEKMLKKYQFIVVSRNDIDLKEFFEKELFEFKDRFHFINLEIDISSTEVREDVENHKDMLTKEVYNYIRKEKIYGCR